MHGTFRLCGTLAASSFLFGCSGDDTGNAASAQPSGQSPASDSPVVAADVAPSKKRGAVSINQAGVGDDPEKSNVHGIVAYFYDTELDAEPQNTCTQSEVRGCTLLACAVDLSKVVKRAKSPELDAGTISVSGGTAPATVVFENAEEGYARYLEDFVLFKPGTKLRVASAGGVVGAFSTTFTTPQPLTMTFPTGYQRTPVPRDSDFVLTWKGGEGTPVTVSAFSRTELVDDRWNEARVTCVVPDGAAGKATLPKEALGQLPPGEHVFNSMSVVQDQSRRVMAGDYQVTVTVNPGNGPSITPSFK